MFDVSILTLFISSSILLIIAPGPDITFTVTQGITNGKKAGFYTAMGLTFGNSIHTLAAAFGLSLIFKTSEIAFYIVKLLGACYLFYLAYKSLKHRKDPIEIKSSTEINAKALFVRGFLMNILNPKVALFFITFLPQFVNHNYDNTSVQIIMLGLIFMVLVAIIFGSAGYFASKFGDWLIKKPHFAELLNIGAASIFVGLGVKLALTQK